MLGGVKVRSWAAALVVCMVAGSSADAQQPLIGFNDSWLNTNPPAKYGTALQAERNLIPNAVPAAFRLPVTWSSIEPTQGNRDWSQFDAIASAAHNHGITLLPNLAGAPAWAAGTHACASGTGGVGQQACILPPGDDPASLQAWRSFIGSFVDRYEADLAGVEIWNEPNYAYEWTTAARPDGSSPGGPDAEHFTQVFCHGLAGVRDENTSLPVIMGGVGDAPPNGVNVPIQSWLDRIYEAPNTPHPPNAGWPNPDPYPDVRTCGGGDWSLGVHPYTQFAPDTDPSQPQGGYLKTLGLARSARDGHGDLPRHLAVTEFGYYGGISGSPNFPTATDANISAWLPCAYRMAVPGGGAAPDGDIDVFIIHRLIDAGIMPIVLNWPGAEANYGVYRAPNLFGAVTPKAQGYAINAMLLGAPNGVVPADHC